jgi:hypothetical protein
MVDLTLILAQGIIAGSFTALPQRIKTISAVGKNASGMVTAQPVKIFFTVFISMPPSSFSSGTASI